MKPETKLNQDQGIDIEQFQALKLDSHAKLFRGDLHDSQNNARPHWYASSDNWSLIAKGYKNAADKLVELVVSRKAIPDEMLYPVLFLYRHYIELRLKEIIQLGKRIATGDLETSHGHDLNSLWNKAKSVLHDKVSGMTDEEIKAFGNIIKQLQEVDTSSAEVFRYPKTTKGKVSLDDMSNINLRHVRDVIDGAAWVLDGSVDFLSEEVR
jgi:hypothetical protein